jgi:hypothetical protein
MPTWKHAQGDYVLIEIFLEPRNVDWSEALFKVPIRRSESRLSLRWNIALIADVDLG